MTWQDILLVLTPRLSSLRRALAKVFDLPEARVAVVQAPLEPIDHPYDVLATLSAVLGDFHAMVSVVIDLQRVATVDPVDGVSRLCQDLGIGGFIDDGSDNPYAGIFISAEGQMRPAKLDPGVEEEGRYVLKP